MLVTEAVSGTNSPLPWKNRMQFFLAGSSNGGELFRKPAFGLELSNGTGTGSVPGFPGKTVHLAKGESSWGLQCPQRNDVYQRHAPGLRKVGPGWKPWMELRGRPASLPKIRRQSGYRPVCGCQVSWSKWAPDDFQVPLSAAVGF